MYVCVLLGVYNNNIITKSKTGKLIQATNHLYFRVKYLYLILIVFDTIANIFHCKIK